MEVLATPDADATASIVIAPGPPARSRSSTVACRRSSTDASRGRPGLTGPSGSAGATCAPVVGVGIDGTILADRQGRECTAVTTPDRTGSSDPRSPGRPRTAAAGPPATCPGSRPG